METEKQQEQILVPKTIKIAAWIMRLYALYYFAYFVIIAAALVASLYYGNSYNGWIWVILIGVLFFLLALVYWKTARSLFRRSKKAWLMGIMILGAPLLYSIYSLMNGLILNPEASAHLYVFAGIDVVTPALINIIISGAAIVLLIVGRRNYLLKS
jgi:hypothetical protein